MRLAGLEPARLAALPPQSSVSANSTISAPWLHWSMLAGVRKGILGEVEFLSTLVLMIIVNRFAKSLGPAEDENGYDYVSLPCRTRLTAFTKELSRIAREDYAWAPTSGSRSVMALNRLMLEITPILVEETVWDRK